MSSFLNILWLIATKCMCIPPVSFYWIQSICHCDKFAFLDNLYSKPPVKIHVYVVSSGANHLFRPSCPSDWSPARWGLRSTPLPCSAAAAAAGSSVPLVPPPSSAASGCLRRRPRGAARRRCTRTSLPAEQLTKEAHHTGCRAFPDSLKVKGLTDHLCFYHSILNFFNHYPTYYQ